MEQNEVNVFDKNDTIDLIDNIQSAIKEAQDFNNYTDANKEVSLDELIDNIDYEVNQLKNYIEQIGEPINSNREASFLFEDDEDIKIGD